MPDILNDYRIWAAQQEERSITHSKRCHLWPRHEACMIHRLAAALEKARLTEAEREAIAWAVSAAEDCQHPADDALRGLLERMGGVI